jgi:hypothetical protein
VVLLKKFSKEQKNVNFLSGIITWEGSLKVVGSIRFTASTLLQNVVYIIQCQNWYA